MIVKGITRPEDAKEAVAHGAKGVVVSNYHGGNAAALPGTLLLIAPVVHAVGDQVPVLADGSFRRGTDILKALGFGAKGVLIGRPVMWGLAAYGADGVQGVVEMLQTELARYMGMCGRPTLASINSSLPLTAIAQAATTPLYLQVYAGSPKVKDVLAEASAAKAKAVFVTVNAGTSGIDWAGVDAVIKGTS